MKYEIIEIESWGQRNEPKKKSFLKSVNGVWVETNNQNIQQNDIVGIYLGNNTVLAVTNA